MPKLEGIPAITFAFESADNASEALFWTSLPSGYSCGMFPFVKHVEPGRYFDC